MRFWIFIVLLNCNLVFSQNLVPNPSFEDYTTCPTGYSQLSYCNQWEGPINDDADYYNTCSTTMGIPYNDGPFGYQPSKTGNGYAGLWMYNGVNNNYREYLRTALLNPLLINECYYIEFYCNLENNLSLAVNNIGLYLSNTPINTTSTGNVLDLQPQVLKLNNPIINDTINWVKISGIFNAIGGEQYITIGNFKNDLNTDTLVTIGNYDGAYYYIEDVSVISIDDIPGSMPAFAGNDVTISQEGDSAFIGQEISNLNCNWSILGAAQIATNTSGLFVQPTTTTTYVVEQTLCGTITYDTVTVYVTVGLEELNELIDLEIYPNPTSGKVIVSSSDGIVGELQIFVMDVTGKEVYTSILAINEGVTNFNLDVESGTYFITFINLETNEKTVKKLTVQK